jgi:hypothetical protein
MTVTDNFWQNLLLGAAAGAALLIFSAIAFAADVPRFAADVPRLDVASACRAAADLGVKHDADRCLKSENDARDQLKAQWADFPAADRSLCTQTATMGGTASYVELITCLELKRDVAKAPADLGLQSRPSNLRSKP